MRNRPGPELAGTLKSPSPAFDEYGRECASSRGEDGGEAGIGGMVAVGRDIMEMDMPTCIDVYDPVFSRHASGDPELKILATGFRFLEGPVWDARSDRLLFSDIKGNAIYTWTPEKGVGYFRDNSYLSNGNTLDHSGSLLTCEHGTSRLSRTGRDGSYEILASTWKGAELNSPNDVIVRSDGLILFTDPPSGRSAVFGIPRPCKIDFQGVYALDPASGELTLLVDDIEFPNGLCLSPDENFLYVNDTRRAHIRVFPISAPESMVEAGKSGGADGRGTDRNGGSPKEKPVSGCRTAKLGNGRIFATMPADIPGAPPGKADGMKFDSSGLLFCTGPGGVLAFGTEGSTAGEVVGRILVPEQTANFCWGGPGLRTLFITASTTLYSVELGLPGLSAPPR